MGKKKEAAKREESHKSSADEENVMDSNELVFSLSPDFMEDISKILEEARRNARLLRKNRTEKTALPMVSRF